MQGVVVGGGGVVVVVVVVAVVVVVVAVVVVFVVVVVVVVVTPDQSSGTVQLQCMGGCHHGGRWCGDTPLRTLGANARDAGYDSKGDARRRLAGCAPIPRGNRPGGEKCPE